MSDKSTNWPGFTPFSLNLHGQLLECRRPQVMGIVNATPDSFYEGSHNVSREEVASRVSQMVAQGADMIDVGAYSSRPGADDVTPQEEIRRLRMAMKALRDVAPNIPVSIDTFRASVARAAVEEMGADIINDISGGELDPEMFTTVADLKVPYIMMHMRGNPSTMTSLTDYGGHGVTGSVISELWDRVHRLSHMGVADIIIDPGFGFAKSVEQNYRLLDSLEALTEAFGRPLLAGMSRKSMIYRPLGLTPSDSLPGTITLHTVAMLKGAAIIRVHDVAEAVQSRDVLQLLSANSIDK
ncbi:MAG: dihydropteroate synthase [Paramuribaculum sp.]|nr:dihydropteroate synthase [Paramuribaculum sp.]